MEDSCECLWIAILLILTVWKILTINLILALSGVTCFISWSQNFLLWRILFNVSAFPYSFISAFDQMIRSWTPCLKPEWERMCEGAGEYILQVEWLKIIVMQGEGNRLCYIVCKDGHNSPPIPIWLTLCNIPFLFFLSRCRVSFTTTWIWANLVTCFDQWNAADMMNVTTKCRSQEVLQLPLLLSWNPGTFMNIISSYPSWG